VIEETRADEFAPEDPDRPEAPARPNAGPPDDWPLPSDIVPTPGTGPRGFARGRSAKRRRGRRADVLDAALFCFERDGYRLTSVQDIATQANASIGSIYHHFRGKEEIAAALYVAGLGDYHRGLLRELRFEHEDAERAVARLVRHHLRWVESNPELARFLFTSRDPEVMKPSSDNLASMNREVFRAVQTWMDRWIEAGAVRRLPFDLLHSVLLGPSQEFCRHWVAGRTNQSIDAAEPVLADAAWKAVRA
jgi:AcrR family transcriptional regulator